MSNELDELNELNKERPSMSPCSILYPLGLGLRCAPVKLSQSQIFWKAVKLRVRVRPGNVRVSPPKSGLLSLGNLPGEGRKRQNHGRRIMNQAPYIYVFSLWTSVWTG